MARRLAFLAATAVLPSTAAGQCWVTEEDLFPSCRKSPILRTLVLDGSQQDALALYGGKGVGLKPSKSGKKLKEDAVFLGDTWIYDMEASCWSAPELQQSTPSASSFSSSSPSSHPAMPKGRWKAESYVLPNGVDLALFGGCTGQSSSESQNDLWLFRASKGAVGGSSNDVSLQGSWRMVPTANPPKGRRGHIVASNSTHLIITGGKDSDGECTSDTWVLPLTALYSEDGTGQWRQGADFPGPCRWGHGGTMLHGKQGQDVLAIFGGRWKNDTAGTYTYYNEVWLYDMASDSWTLADASGPLPQARDHHGTARVGNELWVFAGRVKATEDPDAIMADLWSFSLTGSRSGEWTQLWDGGADGPKRRYMPGVTETPAQEGEHGMIVFGGMELGDKDILDSLFNDMWVFTPSNGWKQLTTESCEEPLNKSIAWQRRAVILVPAVGLVVIIIAVLLNTLRLMGARDEPTPSNYVRLEA